MIKSFKDKDTERVFEGRQPKKLPQAIINRAETKLAALDAARSVEEMGSPPENRLHKLGGDREGAWAVWVDRQFRLCFRFDVEIVDYHD